MQFEKFAYEPNDSNAQVRGRLLSSEKPKSYNIRKLHFQNVQSCFKSKRIKDVGMKIKKYKKKILQGIYLDGYICCLACHCAVARTISALSSCMRSRCVLPRSPLREHLIASFSSASLVSMVVRDSRRLVCRHSRRYSKVMLVRW